MEACCTCASLLSEIDSQTEKPRSLDRRLECCGRCICSSCTQSTPRFQTYCPFCQISTTPSPLPQGLRDPPTYNATNHEPPTYTEQAEPLPAYTPSTNAKDSTVASGEKSGQSTAAPAEDVLHFLDHKQDTVTSLSFRYGVPLAALRRANNLTSDHLLLARRTVIIPGQYYTGGVSLSPRPVEGEDEERRKALVRRFMIGAKVAEYDVAVLYLKQSEYDLDAALEMYGEDERWEAEHPIDNKGKSTSRLDVVQRRFTGQKAH